MAATSLEEISILMVVPSKVLGAVLRRELGDMGVMQMVCCKNIQQALEGMREKEPDLVVSSMYFEDGDGIDLITAMHNEADLKETLVMLISGEERFEMLDPIRQAGVVAMLPRPFTKDALTRTLADSLGMENDRASVSGQDIAALRVLLMDADRDNRKQMLDVLSEAGFTETLIFQAENSAEAIDKLERAGFDLVLADYNMPQDEGDALLNFVRQNDKLDTTPMILIDSGQGSAKLALVKSRGVTAMLDRPLDAAGLKGLLEQYLR